MDASYRFGIEEEYFLADAATRGTPQRRPVKAFHAAAREHLPQAEREPHHPRTQHEPPLMA